MSEGRDVIVRALVEAATGYGFRGVRETNYYRERPETVCVLNLQKSSWGPQFYLNAAIWLTRFGLERRPKEHKCQIRWRVDSLMGSEQSKAFAEALDLDHSMPDDVRLSLIKNGAASHGFGLLARCESEVATLPLVGELGPQIRVALKVYAQEKAN
ncbi:MAG: DUF4304 domain-containing protein [Mesorhizobium sp.]|nr:MAG: DUF4304 domain-containing protein [Mesorhizobium sp.]